MTDGCSRLVERHGDTWPEVWRRLEERGPESLIARVRAHERANGHPARGKRHDDATALVGAFAPAPE